MANIVNDRDIELQLSPVRFGQVPLSPGISVPSSAITDLGTALSSARLVRLEANTTKVAIDSGGVPSTQSVTFTAYPANLDPNVTFSIVEGSATLSVVGTVATLDLADMVSDELTVRVTARPAAGDTGTDPDPGGGGTTNPPPGSNPQPLGQSGWAMTFSDDFAGTALDSGKWNIGGPGGTNYNVAGGSLNIWPIAGYPERSFNTTGKFVQTRGFFEASIKMPRGKGIIPALLGYSTAAGSKLECDIVDARTMGGMAPGSSGGTTSVTRGFLYMIPAAASMARVRSVNAFSGPVDFWVKVRNHAQVGSVQEPYHCANIYFCATANVELTYYRVEMLTNGLQLIKRVNGEPEQYLVFDTADSFPYGGPYRTVGVKQTADRIQVFVDGVLRIDYPEPSFEQISGGHIWLASISADVQFDDANGTLQDSFDGYTNGANADGTTEGNWFFETSNGGNFGYVITTETVTLPGGGTGGAPDIQMTLAAGTEGTPLVRRSYGIGNYLDVTFFVRNHTQAGAAEAYKCPNVYISADVANLYGYRCELGTTFIQIWRRDNGVETLVGEYYAGGIPVGTMMKVRVVQDSSEIRIYYDDEWLIVANDTTYVGGEFFCSGYSNTSVYDDFSGTFTDNLNAINAGSVPAGTTSGGWYVQALGLGTVTWENTGGSGGTPSGVVLSDSLFRPVNYKGKGWNAAGAAIGERYLSRSNAGSGIDLSASFHTYGCDIGPAGIKWYFDGQLVETELATTAMTEQMQIVMALSYETDPALAPNTTDTPLGDTNAMQVAYVRAWVRDANSGGPPPPGQPVLLFVGDATTQGRDGAFNTGVLVNTPYPLGVAQVSGYTVGNSATPGAKLTDWLNGAGPVSGTWASRMASTTATHILINPGIADVLAGTTTTAFKTTLTSLVNAAKAAGKQVTLCTMSPITTAEENFHAIAVHEVATATSVQVIDFHAYLTDYATANGLTSAQMTPDGNYPTQAIYTKMAEYCLARFRVIFNLGGAVGEPPGGGTTNPPPTAGYVAPFGMNAADYPYMTFRDEFNGTELDTQKWGPGFYPNKNNFRVQNGNLYMWAQPPYPQQHEGMYVNENCTFTSDFKFLQKYGYFEAKCSLPYGPGPFPAWWLYGNRNDAGTDDGMRPEIDIMEAYSGGGPASYWSNERLEPNNFAATCHNGNYFAEGTHVVGTRKYSDIYGLAAPLHNRMVVYACRWDANGVQFYVDGQPLGSKIVTTEFNRFMFLIMDYWMGSASGYPDSRLNETISNSLVFEYVRCWGIQGLTQTKYEGGLTQAHALSV